MTTTTAPAARLVTVRVGHTGRAIHLATADNDDKRRATLCGADRRGVGNTPTYVIDAEVTCRACRPSAAGREVARVQVAPVARPTTSVASYSRFDRRAFLTEAVARLTAAGELDRAAEAQADLDAL